MPDFFVDTGTPARDKNSVTPLVNGEEAWRSVYDALMNARDSIHLCFWMLQSEHELLRSSDNVFAPATRRHQYTLAGILNARKAAGVRIRILLWDSLLLRNALQDRFVRLAGSVGTFEVLYQEHPSPIGSWHQKTIIVDDTLAFVGGMNAKPNDWDTDEHAAIDVRRAPYEMDPADRRSIPTARDHTITNPPRHDYMTKITGPIVGDVQANFVQRWNHLVREKVDYYQHARRLPDPEPGKDVGDVKAQISRTIPKYAATPEGETGIEKSYIKAIQLAESYIYIENQYFRSEIAAKELAAAMKRNPKLRVIVVTKPDYLGSSEPGEVFGIPSTTLGIPSTTPSTYWTHAAFEIIRAVRSDFTLFCLQSSYLDRSNRRVFVPIDLHAKLMIVDDVWYTIGSCNLNDRGFLSEGELNVSVQHASAADLRKRVMGLHLGRDCPDSIAEAVRIWFDQAVDNHRAAKSGSKPVSKIFSFRQAGPLAPTLPRTWI